MSDDRCVGGSERLTDEQFERVVVLARAKIEDMGLEGDSADLEAVEAAEAVLDQ